MVNYLLVDDNCMASIPPFNSDGLLPPGDYPATLDELADSVLVWGLDESPTWNHEWRAQLVKNLAVLVEQLWDVGITGIFAGGTFAENKDHPNDIDGYFECDFMQFVTGELERELNRREPSQIWTWAPESRRRYRGYSKGQLPMWHAYRVEMWPNYGQPSGIGNLSFPEAFRFSREDKPRGIVKIIRGDEINDSERFGIQNRGEETESRE